ncbi:hypothetical protein FWH09_01130 [Candidatus Saccharibacteria bacterium]|nr:hypothetical protein [Candidatus Saccharibacteria bacterium]
MDNQNVQDQDLVEQEQPQPIAPVPPVSLQYATHAPQGATEKKSNKALVFALAIPIAIVVVFFALVFVVGSILGANHETKDEKAKRILAENIEKNCTTWESREQSDYGMGGVGGTRTFVDIGVCDGRMVEHRVVVYYNNYEYELIEVSLDDAGLTGTVTSDGDWRIFTSNYGFSFRYPKGWLLEQEAGTLYDGYVSNLTTVISPRGYRLTLYEGMVDGIGGTCSDEDPAEEVFYSFLGKSGIENTTVISVGDSWESPNSRRYPYLSNLNISQDTTSFFHCYPFMESGTLFGGGADLSFIISLHGDEEYLYTIFGFPWKNAEEQSLSDEEFGAVVEILRSAMLD